VGKVVDGTLDPRMVGNVDEVMVGATEMGRVVPGRTHTVSNLENKKVLHFTLLQPITVARGADADDDRRSCSQVGGEPFKQLIDMETANIEPSANC
jgi:hypothetical protein